MAQEIIWQGASGANYRYWIYPVGNSFNPAPGNYIFAKQGGGGWHAVYIGETGDLSERFDSHHKAGCISRNGATHIHVHRNDGGVTARRSEEADLVRRWNPPCND